MTVSAQQPRETTLTIGEGWAVVREVRPMELSVGEQEIVLEGIPAQADLSSLKLRARRIPVDVLDWERVRSVSDTAHPVSGADTLVLHRDGSVRDVRDVGDHDILPAADDPVRCRVRVPIRGVRALEVTYRVEGMQWNSYYQVFIRGEPDGLDESVALDLTGIVRIRNPTGRAFDRARVRLVGADPRLPREPERRPGILMLADTPLSDLWEPTPVEWPPEFEYRLPHLVNLAAFSETDINFLSAHRVPATRLFMMDSGFVPLSLTGTYHPLNQYLVFRNTTANRLGWVLPPGPVEVFHGVTRRTMRLPGFLPHTPVNREIWVDLGRSDDVQGMRRSTHRTETALGAYEEVFLLAVRNDRLRDVMVEIRERPSGTLAWDVQRATARYDLEEGAIRLRTRVDAEDTQNIEMRLRFRLPAL